MNKQFRKNILTMAISALGLAAGGQALAQLADIQPISGNTAVKPLGPPGSGLRRPRSRAVLTW